MIDAPEPDAPPFATGPFGNPVLVSVSSATARDDDVTLTADMLEMFWESDRETAGQSDLYTSRRAKVGDVWSLPSKVIELSSASAEGSANISGDGLTIYFASNRSPSANMDIYVATRADRASPWRTPEVVASLSDPSSSDYDAQPWSSTVLYLGSARPPAKGGSDVYRATRTSPSGTWTAPALVPGLDTQEYEGEMFADSQGAMWITSTAAGDDDIWRAQPDPDNPGTFLAPTIITEICGPAAEDDPWLSPDGHTIFFTSNRNSSTLDIYMATR